MTSSTWLSTRVAMTTALVSILALSGQAAAQEASDLAKASQNPIANLTTFPVQFNFLSGGDLQDRSMMMINLQPVLPLPINARWNVISRTIMSITDLPKPGGGRETGIADIQQQLYFTPAAPGDLVWGVGPVLSVPAATNDALSTGQWGLGPAAVLLTNRGPWVIGVVANNIWRVAGDTAAPELNLFTLQPFVNFNMARGWFVASSPVITANWSAPQGEKWTVPLGLGVGKVQPVGTQPISITMQYYHNIERPQGSAADVFRVQVSFLFPAVRPKAP